MILLLTLMAGARRGHPANGWFATGTTTAGKKCISSPFSYSFFIQLWPNVGIDPCEFMTAFDQKQFHGKVLHQCSLPTGALVNMHRYYRLP